MNDLEAAIGLEGLEQFDQTVAIRRRHLARLWELLSPLSDRLILYRDGPGETVSPHAFPLVLRDAGQSMEGFYRHLEEQGIQCKTLFGSLPTQHRAFAFLGYREGEVPVAERIGRSGLHFGVHQYLTDDDIEYAADCVKAFFR
jgi:dTDP-4-amino-4,6-dideoxygalactose transaminase